MQTTPFWRIHAMMALFAQAMSLPTEADRRVALSNIGPYQSRGHGHGGRYHGTSTMTVARAKRMALKTRNRAKNRAAHRG